MQTCSVILLQVRKQHVSLANFESNFQVFHNTSDQILCNEISREMAL